MVNRLLSLPKKHSFFLFGARQTGKSTLIKVNFTKRVWKIDLLQSENFIKYSKDPAQFRLEAENQIKKGIKTVIIDEVQREPLLLNEVQYLMGEYPSCQFVLTGSSARKLKRGGANLLGGRAWVEHLYPLVWSELGQPAGLDDILQYGSLPSLIGLSKQDKTRTLIDYTHMYIKEEVQAEGIVRRLGAFNRFLEMAASQSGELVSLSAISRECFIPVKTVQSYYQVLEDTLLGLRLEPWDKSVRKRMVGHPKFYLFDIGVTNAFNNRLTGPIDLMTQGRLFEQFIILETQRMKDYLKSDQRLYFYRTNNGAEVDLLIEKNGQLTAAIEIKKMKTIKGGELSGLRSLRQEYPKVPCYVVACVDLPYELENVKILPWQEYLKTIKKFLV